MRKQRRIAGWMGVALAVGLSGEWVAAQTQDILPTLKWTVRGRYPDFPGANANDEGTCIGYYLQPGQGGGPAQP